MTPTEALTRALRAAGYRVSSFAIAAALAADGWTLARTADARDGEALRLLHETATSKRYAWSVALDGPGYVARVSAHNVTLAEGWSGCDCLDPCDCPRPTLAEACLSALKALGGDDGR